jgi:drug/metabolite transporter (DMT)-like permease
MLFIVLAICTSVFLLCLFKLFDKFNVNTVTAIIVNYAAAAITGFLVSSHKSSFFELEGRQWLLYCIPLGFLFFSVFYLMSLTIQKISVAAGSVANKMSVVMPVLFSVFFLGEELDFLKISGVVMALVAVYFATKQKSDSEDKTAKKLIWLPVLVFVGSGIIDISLNAAKTYLFITDSDSELFTTYTFFFAFVFGLLSMPFKKLLKLETKFNLKNVLWGLALGIPNYFSIFFIIKSLDADVLQSSQLFPVLNISNVALAAITGYILFKEKLSVQNIFGVVLAVLSIILITI